jgi:XRE family transcriptional regulator, regulator of sulfur utilization
MELDCGLILLAKERMMNRRELFAAIAAAALAGDALVFAEQPPSRPTVMGSRVFDWNSLVDKPNATGSVRTVCNTPTATLENLEIHVSTLKPGMMSHPPHKHPNEELIIVRQGTVETLSNGEWIRVGPGSIVFNASNQLHGFKNVGTELAIYHVINFKTAATPAA